MKLNETVPKTWLTLNGMNSFESSDKWKDVNPELSMDAIIGEVVEKCDAFKRNRNLILNKYVAKKKLNKNSRSRIFLEQNVANMLELSKASIMAFQSESKTNKHIHSYNLTA